MFVKKKKKGNGLLIHLSIVPSIHVQQFSLGSANNCSPLNSASALSKIFVLRQKE